MKKISQLWNYIEGLNGVLLSIYSIFVFSTYSIVTYSAKKYLLRQLFIIVVLSIIICPIIIRCTRKISIKSNVTLNSDIEKNRWKFMLFIIPFVVFLMNYIVYFPGGLVEDSIWQYAQAIKNDYNDWHPVIHTLIFFKFPLVLTGNWVGSIALFNLTVFAIAIAYSLYTILQYTNKKYTIIAMAFIMLKPQTAAMAIIPIKDTAFSIGALLLLSFSIHIFNTNGIWLKKPIHMIAFVITITLTTLFRHNALLFTVPLFFAIVFYVSKKRFLVMILSVLMLIIGIKLPVYSIINVEQPGSRQIETLGLPMSVIGAVVTYAPETLDKETKEFAYKVAAKESWKKYYKYGSYNQLKWNDKTNNHVIEEYGALKVLSMAGRCFKNCPNVALKGLIKLTDVVYTVSDEYCYYLEPFVEPNQYDIQMTGIPFLRSLNTKYFKLTNIMFPHLFMYFGSIHMILLLSILSKLKLNNKKSWKKILFILPVLLYNFGSALLLTGAGDSNRYFYYTFLITPVLLVFIYRKGEKEEADIIVCEKE